MKITQALLDRYGAPPLIEKQILKYFSEGAPVEKIIYFFKEKKEFLDIAHWIYNNLPISTQEKQEIDELLEIKNSSHYYNCFNITNSTNIISSKNIKNSRNILWSENLADSKLCVRTYEGEKLAGVYNSQFCNNSNHLLDCQTCTDSTNLISSTMCIKSQHLYHCHNVIRGSHLVNCDRTKDSHFSSWCNKLTFSFFCSRTQGDYLLFNEHYDSELYEIILKQYQNLVRPLCFCEWPVENELFSIPDYTANYSKYYFSQQDRFWEWVRTLPNYNPKIMYEITCLPIFLDK